MTALNVKFFAFGRFTDNKILGCYAVEKAFEVAYLKIRVNS